MPTLDDESSEPRDWGRDVAEACFCYYSGMVRRCLRFAILLTAASSCSVFGLSDDLTSGKVSDGGSSGGATGGDGSIASDGSWANGGSSAAGAAGKLEDAATDGGAGAATGGVGGNAGAGGSGGSGGSGNTGGSPPCPFPNCQPVGTVCGDNCECCTTNCLDQTCQ